jgi:hypothetical protein
MLDLYEFLRPGGILGTGFIINSAETRTDPHASLLEIGAGQSKPVDEDTGGRLLAEATQEHQANFDLRQSVNSATCRDTYWNYRGMNLEYTIEELGPSAYLKDIERSGVAIYHLAGWFDFWPRDALSYMATLNNPSKILIGPYWHGRMDEALVWEHLRFFDRYLKGINNGVDTEPPYYFYTLGRDKWRAAHKWPLPEQRITPYYFAAGGGLSMSAPGAREAFDNYVVDYSTTSGSTSRRGSNVSAFSYPDRAEQDKKCLTYTTPPLERELEVTGHPIMHLYLSSTAADGDFFVYLEDVDEQNVVHYVTEGQIRASLRKLRPRPWLPELPWQGCYHADVEPLTLGEIEELTFDLLPTSYVFGRGHRVRAALAGADKNNYATPELSPAPTINVYRSPQHASYLELPVIPFSANDCTGFWYNPDEPGTGISLEVQDGVLYLTWFVYDEETGLSVWFTSGAEMSDSYHYSGALLKWTGWPVGSAYTGARAEPAGTIELTFDSASEAHLTWHLDGNTGSKSLVRFMDEVSPGSKDLRDIAGWWYDPDFEGMGFFLEAQGNNLFMTWYHYRGDGSPRWWTSGGSLPHGSESYGGDLVVWVQGQCIGCRYRAPRLMPGSQSSMELRFLSDARATLTWNRGTLHLERFRFSQLQ